MKNKIRIASGQGFWGDLVDAPLSQVTAGEIDYLVLDYLAEVTMSILQKQKLKNPTWGYARDVPRLMKKILPICKKKNIRIITNGGGVNPEQCAISILNMARLLRIPDLKIAVVSGDDILSNVDHLLASGVELKNMETGQSIATVRDKLLSANVYLGAMPIVQGLECGADVVITGRTTDTGLTLAAMIHEFGWQEDQYDLMAAGTIAGHLLECGGQASGGNFLGDWQSIEDMANIGFPIAEAYPNGEFILTKHETLGGKVSFDTVAEQLVYEIGDPKNYITPECVADFSSVQLKDLGDNRVKVFGIKGAKATDTYKVSCSYSAGYMSSGVLTYSWPNALTKARAADQILRQRLANLNLHFSEFVTEFVGYNSCHGPLSKEIDEDLINEIVLRVAVRSSDYYVVERFGMEIAPLILTGPPSVTGFAGGRPHPHGIVAYWPALIAKSLVKPKIRIIREEIL